MKTQQHTGTPTLLSQYFVALSFALIRSEILLGIEL